MTNPLSDRERDKLFGYDPLGLDGPPKPYSEPAQNAIAPKRQKIITDEMIQVACVAAYGVGSNKDSNLYKLMKRALTAALAMS